jgi:hypothetical protein
MQKHIGVHYVYEESRKSKVESRKSKVEGQKSKVENVVTAAALTGLPEELFTRLRHAVNMAEPGLVNQLTAGIRKQNPALADVLAELVKQFRFDILQALFEEMTP